MNTKLVCFVNGVYSTNIGGGDIYFTNLVKDIPIHVYGGHATKMLLDRYNINYTIALTDREIVKIDSNLGLFFNHFWRYISTCMHTIQCDTAYAMSDYWFDVLPLLRCKARKKILYLGMIAPFRLSPAGLHYWISQRLMLRKFKGKGLVTYSHPDMLEYLKGLGYKEENLHYIPNSFDTETCDSVPTQERIYDVVWIGRIHPQKGIEDLVEIIKLLDINLIRLKVLLIGKDGPRIKKMLPSYIDIKAPGIVSETEKFRLLKSSRVFIFPSHYESFGISVGEALMAGCRVVAYDLDCYSVFEEYPVYVKSFKIMEFISKTMKQLEYSRIWRLDTSSNLTKKLSWINTRKKFKALL